MRKLRSAPLELDFRVGGAILPGEILVRYPLVVKRRDEFCGRIANLVVFGMAADIHSPHSGWLCETTDSMAKESIDPGAPAGAGRFTSA